MTHGELPAWKKQLPMWLTWARMALCIPMAAIMLTMSDPWGGYLAAFHFIIASITDWLDGYYARLFNAQSTMGKFMDPIADKILVSTILILLIPSGRIGPIVVILLLAHDILIGGIRSVAAADRVIIDAKATERETALASGKPADIAEKMLDGRMRKFFEEDCLTEQAFIMVPDTKVSAVVEKAAKAAGTSIKLAGYIRYQLGEGIEVGVKDFASEVASVVNG